MEAGGEVGADRGEVCIVGLPFNALRLRRIQDCSTRLNSAQGCRSLIVASTWGSAFGINRPWKRYRLRIDYASGSFVKKISSRRGYRFPAFPSFASLDAEVAPTMREKDGD